MIPLGAYVHLPWCVRKCPYCDFNSHARKGAIPETEYVAALLEDLEHDLPKIWGRTVSSIFLGGGTPSLFSGPALADLLKGLMLRVRCEPDVEITMECNPGTAEYAPFEEIVAAGVNRLSIGAQSFNNDALKALGRIHRAEETDRAVERARAAGITNLNLDIMYGLPGQTVADGLHDLERALALKPEHLSWYQLTIEPNTLFAARPPELPDEDIIAELQEQGQALLHAAGFEHYEVSAYARPGRRCAHNLNYWLFGDYLGIGAGAHAKLTMSGRIERTIRQRQPRAYLTAPATERLIDTRDPTPQELRFEFALNAFRLNAGFSETLYEARTGLHSDTLEPELAQLIAKGLVEREGQLIRTTALGQRFLNDVTGAFL